MLNLALAEQMYVREQKKTRPGGRGEMAYAATGSAAGAGVLSGCGAAGRGLVTPAMKRSTSLIALSMERQGSSGEKLKR